MGSGSPPLFLPRAANPSTFIMLTKPAIAYPWQGVHLRAVAAVANAIVICESHSLTSSILLVSPSGQTGAIFLWLRPIVLPLQHLPQSGQGYN